MVFIVVQAWYPAKIARLVAQKYLEVTQKYPPESLGETVFGPILNATKEGIHVIQAWGCKDDKIKDSLREIGKAMLMLAEIEGYQYSMDTYADAIEAFTMIGMTGP